MSFKVPAPKRIYNDEELEAETQRVKNEQESKRQYKKSKHSLDSDEEDEEETQKKYNVLDPNELEGQEEGTIDYDGGIKITPFNMKEELEEGYFDKDGTYIFNKEADVIKDQWLDDIDWVKIKSIEKKPPNMSDDESDEELPSLNLGEHYKKMLDLMKSGETVRKAICRLGGSSSSRSASRRWKRKNKKENSDDNKDDETAKQNQEKMQELTRLADDIIHTGNMDIYEYTYEKLLFHVNKSGSSKKGESLDNPDGLDMFGDNFDEKVDETKPQRETARTPSPSTENFNDDEVIWEFKWEASEDAKIYGPYSTTQMIQWQKDKYFEDGVLVRPYGKPHVEFYTSKRMDFELFL